MIKTTKGENKMKNRKAIIRLLAEVFEVAEKEFEKWSDEKLIKYFKESVNDDLIAY